MTTKTCRKCFAELAIADFYRRYATCKRCVAVQTLSYRSAHRERIASAQRAYYAAHKVERREYWLQFRAEQPNKHYAQSRARSARFKQRLAKSFWKYVVAHSDPELRRSASRRSSNRCVTMLSDGYVAQTLRIPVALAQSLIPLKRALLQLRRELKKETT